MKKIFWVIAILLVIFNLSIAQDSKVLEQASSDIVLMSEDDLIEGEHSVR